MSKAKSYVPDWLDKRAQLTPEKLALVDAETNQEYTYAKWNENSNQTARFLADLGVQKGDRVAVLASNCIEYMDIWFACNKTGAILQNLNWRLTPVELKEIIDDARPRVLIYSQDFKPVVKELQDRLLSVKTWIALTKTIRPGDLKFSTRKNFSVDPFPMAELDQDDTWVICYTGGTTGLPKGAMLTYRAVNTNAVNTVMSWGLDCNDTAICNAPLFHTGGLNVFTAPLVQAGGVNIICKKFDVEQTFDLIKNKGATLFFGVPTMFITMQEHTSWADADFSRCKLVIAGGAPTPLDVLEKFWEKGVDFKTGYGLTEAGPNNFWLPSEDIKRKPGFVGKPLFHVNIKLVDKDNQEITGPGVGEIAISGDHICAGYWNNESATKKTIVDGWLYTGDIALRDEQGYYKIVDRLKDMIISGGENIYPAEIESAIFGHDKVKEVCVIGVPDDKWGEVSCACIVKNDDSLTKQEIIMHCSDKLAKYKIPKYIRVMDDLPKTGAGKFDKKILKTLVNI